MGPLWKCWGTQGKVERGYVERGSYTFELEACVSSILVTNVHVWLFSVGVVVNYHTSLFGQTSFVFWEFKSTTSNWEQAKLGYKTKCRSWNKIHCMNL